jgi:hypothetical protein
MKATKGSKVQANFDEGNRACARLILANIERHGGKQSLAGQWAQRILNPAPPKDSAAGPLFQSRGTK